MMGSHAGLEHVVYVRPSFGGIYDYSEAILRVLRAEYSSVRVEVLTIRTGRHPASEGRRVAREIGSHPGLVYVDLGGGDRTIFWALHHVPADRDLVLTIHDPGLFVNRLFQVPGVERGPFAVRAAAHICEKATNTAIGQWLFRRVLRRARVRIVLNESVHELWGFPLTYLPQPVYSPRIVPHSSPPRPCFAYAGYWGPTKGLDELLAAYRELLPRFPQARFVIAGSAPPGGERWGAGFAARVRAASERIEMPGFIPAEEFDAFLRGLTALVLPYRAEVPGAASAMLMRAQQAGVPLIVSDTPFLRAQVDARSVTIVPPRDAQRLVNAIEAHLADPAIFDTRAAREQERIFAAHGDARVGRMLREILDASYRGGERGSR